MITCLLAKFGQFARRNDAATATEYAVLIGLIAVVCIAGLVALGLVTAGMFTSADTTTIAL